MDVQQGSGMRIPLKSWVPLSSLDELAHNQAVNLALLPFAFHHVALMADGHGGYGMPVGGVLATRSYVIPYAVGNDIGCGMTAIRIHGIPPAWLQERYQDVGSVAESTRARLILQKILRDVPTGNGPRGEHEVRDTAELPASLMDEYERQRLGPQISPFNTFGYMERQLGTLGGGNHFIELEQDNEGVLWLMLHSGSRGLGAKVCTHFNRVAQQLNDKYFSTVTRGLELAFLPLDSDEGRAYIAWMNFAQAYAKANRDRIALRALAAIERITKCSLTVDPPIDTHHNYAVFENHFGQDVLITRKGAVRARVGDMCIIPGSMETGSYIAEGLGNPDSFMSCQHGAGRAMSRKAAKAARTSDDLVSSMAEKGIVLAAYNAADVVDEGGHAYKDLSVVMAASTDLVKPVYELKPLGVVKGSDSR